MCCPKAYETCMYLSSLTIRGLSDLPSFSVADLGRTVVIDGPSPAASAVGDGLSLLFGSLNETALRRLLMRWGLIHSLDDAEIDADPLPTQATWSDRYRAKTLVSDQAQRRLQVTAEILLDPPLSATLRAAAAGEPRLGLGLGSDSSVRLDVSAFFGSSWDVLSVSIQAVIIGGERFPCAPKERAPWMTSLLTELGQRFANHDQTSDHARAALDAMTSTVPAKHDGYLQFTRVVGDVRPAQHSGGEACLLLDHRPISRMGPARERAIHAAATATLHNVDIMWMGDSDPWGAALTESDSAPLEQLWTVASGGAVSAEPGRTDPGVLSFGMTEE